MRGGFFGGRSKPLPYRGGKTPFFGCVWRFLFRVGATTTRGRNASFPPYGYESTPPLRCHPEEAAERRTEGSCQDKRFFLWCRILHGLASQVDVQDDTEKRKGGLVAIAPVRGVCFCGSSWAPTPTAVGKPRNTARGRTQFAPAEVGGISYAVGAFCERPSRVAVFLPSRLRTKETLWTEAPLEGDSPPCGEMSARQTKGGGAPASRHRRVGEWRVF